MYYDVFIETHEKWPVLRASGKGNKRKTETAYVSSSCLVLSFEKE